MLQQYLTGLMVPYGWITIDGQTTKGATAWIPTEDWPTQKRHVSNLILSRIILSMMKDVLPHAMQCSQPSFRDRSKQERPS